MESGDRTPDRDVTGRAALRLNPSAAAERLRRRALELGFDAVGVAPADPPAHAAWYREWLERGWHGAMGYLAREDAVRRRVSLQEALPGCRSVIVVALSYAPPEGGSLPEGGRLAETTNPLAPVVARYARGRDYHGVFEEKLAALAGEVEAIDLAARALPYVDYGPVIERDHAQRAGLGWIGKNTVLIDPELGSWLLLGELLTTLELEPDDPFTADRCGSCNRCIEACPTGAIRGERQLDARLCISYLTIELRGAIPEELRPAIGNRVFGCDICQDVCPWNRDVPAGSLPGQPAGGAPATEGTPRPGRPVPFGSMIEWAEELLALDEEGFRDRYRHTALYRARRGGLLRNLCVGLGNSGRREAVPVLGRCLAEGPAMVAEHAAWALKRLGEG
jgi:epoxyqueuosine reductase